MKRLINEREREIKEILMHNFVGADIVGELLFEIEELRKESREYKQAAEKWHAKYHNQGSNNHE